MAGLIGAEDAKVALGREQGIRAIKGKYTKITKEIIALNVDLYHNTNAN